MSRPHSKTALLKAQEQSEEVVGIMRNNIDKALARGEQIDDIGDKAEYLKQNATRFSSTSSRLKNRMWWNNMKFKLGCAIVIVLIGGAVALSVLKPWEHSASSAPPPPPATMNSTTMMASTSTTTLP
eukprot:m.83695 g.83695  ORF g.83695 m.83695 type:complete len:127 (-) comp25660_c1_seq1:144-524(-)